MSSLDIFSNDFGARGRFSSPWSDIAQQYAPRSIRDCWILAEFLYENTAVYKAASERVVNYFLTKIKLSGQSDGELEKFRPIMERKFGITGHLREIGNDFQMMGNSISQMIPSFIRCLKCVSCKKDGNDSVVNILKTDFEFRIGDLSFYARCNKCKKTCRHMVHDYPDPNPENIKLVRRNIKHITIEHNPERGIKNYWMDIDPIVASKIKGGDKFMVSTTPWSIIQAVSKNQRYKLSPEFTHHMAAPCAASLNFGGWGMPPILNCLKELYRLQTLRKVDESLMNDWMTPIRLISPAGGGGSDGNSMMATANLNSFKAAFENAVLSHRRDSADWNIFPMPVEYQPVGGEGRELSPKEMIADEEDRLLNARGIPPQLYRGDLLLQTAPTALRLFERTHQPLVDGLNAHAQWMVTCLARQLKSGDIESEMASITLVDDLQQSQAKMQLMQAQIISKETGLEQMNIDPKNERKRIIEEQKSDQREQQKAQQELEMENMNLDTPEGDAQGTGAGGGSTPMDIQGQGQSMAQQLLDPSVPEQARRQQLTALRQQNPTLHAVVIKEMDKLRNQAGTAGAAAAMPQVIQQAQQTQQAAPQKLASINLITPDLKNNDQLVDSAVDFSKVAGHFPTEIHLTRADEFGLIKWGAQNLGIDLEKMGDIRRTGTLDNTVNEILGMKLIFNAKETSFA